MPDVKLGMTYSQRERALAAFEFYLDHMKNCSYAKHEIADVADMIVRLGSTKCGDPGCEYCDDTTEA